MSRWVRVKKEGWVWQNPPPYPFRHMLLKEKKVMSGNARYLNDAG